MKSYKFLFFLFIIAIIFIGFWLWKGALEIRELSTDKGEIKQYEYEQPREPYLKPNDFPAAKYK